MFNAARSTVVLFFLLCCGVASAQAEGIGLIAPLSGQVALLGQQMRDGAELAAETIMPDAGALQVADDACTAEGGEAAARQMVEAQVQLVIGFLCTESIRAALPALSAAGIPVVTPGVRTDSLTDNRERDGSLIYRMTARADGEREAVSRLLIPRWRDALFALVDDGTIYGRELIESFRLAAENAGLKAVFVDTYRPQMENQVGLVSRLRRAGATHVLVGGDREDVAIIGRDAAGLDFPLTIAAGEALRAAAGNTPLAEGTLMVGLPEPAEIASQAALEAFARRDLIPEGYMLPAYAAVELARTALERADESGRTVTQALSENAFPTSLGEIRFDQRGDLSQSPYRLYRFDGQSFVKAE